MRVWAWLLLLVVWVHELSCVVDLACCQTGSRHAVAQIQCLRGVPGMCVSKEASAEDR